MSTTMTTLEREEEGVFSLNLAARLWRACLGSGARVTAKPLRVLLPRELTLWLFRGDLPLH